MVHPPNWPHWLALFLLAQPLTAHPSAEIDPLELDLESLMALEVTSVSKQSQRLIDTAAAIFVITQTDIKNSGATSIAEVLRMAPGINISRIDSNKWAITARGFNGNFANKLLVLIDGRSVYNSTFSGVYWEVQDVLLDDIERIEVIRGPGAAVWGANAVNGVINIIRKHSADTQQTRLTTRIGDYERNGEIRYGNELSANRYGRVYIKQAEYDRLPLTNGLTKEDHWDKQQAGFRLDAQPTARSTFNVQGDIYQSTTHDSLQITTTEPPFFELAPTVVDSAGGNLMSSWRQIIDAGNEWKLQAYYDYASRDELYINEQQKTVDLEFQHQIAITPTHQLIYGVGYRWIHDDFNNIENVISINPEVENSELFSAFFQHQIALNSTLSVILGSKFEHNDFSGFETQPHLRLLWSPNQHHTVWMGIARAVRTPSRSELGVKLAAEAIPANTGINATPFPLILELRGNPQLISEALVAYELGYRTQPTRTTALDIAAFVNCYHHLRNSQLGEPEFEPTGIRQPVLLNNGMTAQVSGIELAAHWHPYANWQWQLAYSYLDDTTVATAGSEGLAGIAGIAATNNTPRHQLSLRSSWHNAPFSINGWLRYTDALTLTSFRGNRFLIDAYTTLDIKLGWQIHKNWELSVVGQNLLDPQRPEYVQEFSDLSSEVVRSVYGQVRWEF